MSALFLCISKLKDTRQHSRKRRLQRAVFASRFDRANLCWSNTLPWGRGERIWPYEPALYCLLGLVVRFSIIPSCILVDRDAILHPAHREIIDMFFLIPELTYSIPQVSHFQTMHAINGSFIVLLQGIFELGAAQGILCMLNICSCIKLSVLPSMGKSVLSNSGLLPNIPSTVVRRDTYQTCLFNPSCCATMISFHIISCHPHSPVIAIGHASYHKYFFSVLTGRKKM